MFNTDVYASLFNKLTENEQRVLLSIRGQKITPPPPVKLSPVKLSPPEKCPKQIPPGLALRLGLG